jgi:DHA1 family tetracycline resistance protein-like MFS transporter
MTIAGLARGSFVYMASIPIISLWNISFPAAQGMMTHRVSEREQGELQGAIQSLRSIAFIIGPFLFAQTFAWFIDPTRSFQIPGAPYYLAAAMLFVAMLLATRLEETRVTAQPIQAGDDVVTPSGLPIGDVATNPEENI